MLAHRTRQLRLRCRSIGTASLPRSRRLAMCARALRKGVLRVRCCRAVASVQLGTELRPFPRVCVHARRRRPLATPSPSHHRDRETTTACLALVAAAVVRHALTVSRGKSETDERGAHSEAEEIVPSRAERSRTEYHHRCFFSRTPRKRRERVGLDTGSFCPIDTKWESADAHIFFKSDRRPSRTFARSAPRKRREMDSWLCFNVTRSHSAPRYVVGRIESSRETRYPGSFLSSRGVARYVAAFTAFPRHSAAASLRFAVRPCLARFYFSRPRRGKGR